jgi:hypothetical protein
MGNKIWLCSDEGTSIVLTSRIFATNRNGQWEVFACDRGTEVRIGQYVTKEEALSKIERIWEQM